MRRPGKARSGGRESIDRGWDSLSGSQHNTLIFYTPAARSQDGSGWLYGPIWQRAPLGATGSSPGGPTGFTETR
jgi:hypothetical protein